MPNASSLVKSQALENRVYTGQEHLLGRVAMPKILRSSARTQAAACYLGKSIRARAGAEWNSEEARQYQPGDDIRSIDWKVTARTGITHTKLFQEERERPVHIIVDQRSSMFFGSQSKFKSVLAAELAAIVAWAALGGSDRIGGQVVGDQQSEDFKPRRDRHTVLKLLHTIAQFNRALPPLEAYTPQPLSEVLQEAKRVVRPGTSVFIFSDFADMDERAEEALSLMGRHCELTLFEIYDNLEQGLPALGTASVSNGNEQQQVHINRAIAQRFEERSQQRATRLKRTANRARAYYARVGTHDDSAAFLKRLYG